MLDKCHYQWIYNDLYTQVKIFMAQKKTFDFMKRLGDDVDEVVRDIKGIDTQQGQLVYLDLIDLEIYYYKMANGIGEKWLEVE